MAQRKQTKTALIIVESPAKAKTIQSYLGDGYKVIASGGHILDLPETSLGVDVSRNFAVRKEIIPARLRTVENLKKEISRHSRIYIATDPDREGEAIGFDIRSLTSGKKEWIRVGFREITKAHILEKIQNPDEFSPSILRAQLARRIIDRLFGYKVSSLLWKKIRGGLSAGRVQSVLLRWICEREEEIRKFEPEEFYELRAETQGGIRFRWEGNSHLSSQEFQNEWRIRTNLSFPPPGKKGKYPVSIDFTVDSFTKKEFSQSPPPPFCTASLQEASAKILGFSPAKTMRLAQILYEGVELGHRRMGVITYPRTDSERIAPEFQNQILKFIRSTVGKEYLGRPRSQARSRLRIQNAHEAIRPTELALRPEDVRNYLSNDAGKLYDLIWRRTLAAFTSPYRYIQSRWILEGMHANWTFEFDEEVFPGYKIWYERKSHSPVLFFAKEGDTVKISSLEWEWKQTSPPSRYTHASLVKKMESTGIGRPSTYSLAIEILSRRAYISWEKKHCKPTSIGEEVNRFLTKGFSDFLCDRFTKNLEEELDEIETGQKDSKPVLKEFYEKLEAQIESAKKLLVAEICPLCNRGIVQKKKEKSGKIIAYCSRFPDCEYGEYV